MSRMRRGWLRFTLFFTERKELADANVELQYRCKDLHFSLVKANATNENALHDLAWMRADLEMLLLMVPDRAHALGLLRDAHRIRGLDQCPS